MRALAILGLAALLSSCAALPAPPSDGFDPSAYDGRPLRARIVDVSGRLLVDVSRPAHVAIFEIVPGQGVGLLYPAYSGERNYLYGGMNSVFVSRSRQYYSYFSPSPYTSREPRYLYMVASDAPLRLSGLMDAPGALRRHMGLASFASMNPYSLMDDLASLVLPYGARGDWTDDVYVIWPNRSYDTGNYRAEQWVRVRCDDGRVVEGPAYYVLGACAQAPNAPPLRKDPEQPRDSSAVRPPTRTRPEPEGKTGDDTGARVRPPTVEPVAEPERRELPQRERIERRTGDRQRFREDDASPRVERREERETESRPEPRESRPEPRSEA
ncbi:MAG TPA: hypothetical protein VGR37_14735, partial [Longimicrobiaceae bacterium]|nr:hypothetical protein [Longimicrobiaceae bacterium]